MSEIVVFTAAAVVVEEQVSFTLSALCEASGAGRDLVHGLVGEGLLQPTGFGPDGWRFSGDALPQAKKAWRLTRDLDLDLAAVSLVLDLLAEIDRLRSTRRHP